MRITRHVRVLPKIVFDRFHAARLLPADPESDLDACHLGRVSGLVIRSYSSGSCPLDTETQRPGISLDVRTIRSIHPQLRSNARDGNRHAVGACLPAGRAD